MFRQTRTEDRRRLARRLAFTLIELAVILAIVGVMLAVAIRLFSGGPHQSRRGHCSDNLKRIALALHNYHAEHGTLPSACVKSNDGQPMHCWRVLLLPYLGQQKLYDSYDFGEPWDGPNNWRLIEQAPAVYRCPSDDEDQTKYTSYLAIVDAESAWPEGGARPFEQIIDASDTTILVVESAQTGILWTEPRDLYLCQMTCQINASKHRCISSKHLGGATIAWCDGSVSFLSESVPPETIQAMITVAGGERITNDDLYGAPSTSAR